MKSILEKIILTIIVLSSCRISAYAQYGKCHAGSKELEKLKQTTTVVILSKYDTVYNKNVEFAFKNLWKINPYVFVQEDRISTYFQPTYSFFYKVSITMIGMHDTSIENFFKLGLNKGKAKNLVDLKEIAWIQVDRKFDSTGYDFCIVNLVQAMHNYLEYSETHKSTANSSMDYYYNSRIPDLKSKTLLINKDYLQEKFITLEQIKAIYKYNVRIVDKEEIEKAVKEQNPEIAYFYIVFFKLLRSIYVITADGGNVIYAAHHSDNWHRNILDEGDLKRLSSKLK